MNIRIEVGLAGLTDPDGNPVVVGNTGVFDMFLSPFYAMEQDVMGVFGDEMDRYFDQIRSMIFENSIKADLLLNAGAIANSGMSAQEVFLLKRQYVICKTVYSFGKIFHRDYMRSVKKSKFLADVKVSLEIERDPGMLARLFNDARECWEEIEALFDLAGGHGFMTFVKGRSNACNRTSSREWWPTDGRGGPRVPIAASKASNFCRKYKIGVNN